MQKLLKGGTLVCEDKIFKSDILLQNEKILRVAENIYLDEVLFDTEVIDVSGKLLMPGIIDAHTHYQLKSRNTVTADDFFSGSTSAAYGGVTTFIDYSDHIPGVSLKESLNKRINEALGRTVVDFSLHQNIVRFDEKVYEELATLQELGIASIKIFTTYRREGYMIPKTAWEQVFRRLKEVEVLVTIHAEDDNLIFKKEEKFVRLGLTLPKMHPHIRPDKAEELAVWEVGELGQKVGIPVYIAHLSSKAGLEALQRVKKAGGKIYAETTPHYLLLTAELLKEPDAQKYIMTPPLRSENDLEALWKGLTQRTIQVVATDHCSFKLAQKLQDNNCLTILPGLPGSETLLPLIHHFGVGKGLFGYPELVHMLAVAPAQIFGLYPEKGSLKPGTDADIVVFDPEKEVVLSGATLHSGAGYTPYEGIKVKGYPVMTFLRGEMIVKEGTFCGKPGYGKFVRGSRSCLYNDSIFFA